MPISYHDWQNGFKKKGNLDEINSLGMTRREFREYVQKWKEDNMNTDKMMVSEDE